MLSQRKVRTWQKSYETIMIRYIDLCIDLRDYARGKDGLHQYRNLSQANAPGSLEVSHPVDASGFVREGGLFCSVPFVNQSLIDGPAGWGTNECAAGTGTAVIQTQLTDVSDQTLKTLTTY